MRIAFINKFQGSVNRGAERFVLELSKRLSKNHQVDVLTGINFFKKYDLIIPTNGRIQTFVVRIWTWLTGTKMIISGQSGAGLDDRLNLYSFPDAFVALSNHQLAWAKKINPLVKSDHIPNGVDLKIFKGRILKAGYTILSVGAFTKEKRHDLTVKAVAKLKNVNLIIVGGGGELKQNIEDLGNRVLGKKRFEVIQTTNSKMPEVYSRASVLAFPSVSWESFGIVLVEAMASGLPVVCTNDPIRREIVGNAGLFVDPTNIEKYSQSLKRAMNINWDDKPRKQAEKFSWDKIAKDYEKLFKTI